MKRLRVYVEKVASKYEEYEEEVDETKKAAFYKAYEELKDIRDNLKLSLDLEKGLAVGEIRQIDRREKVGFDHFARCILNVALQKSPGEVFDFQRSWWDTRETECQKLYVRSCYVTLFQECEKVRAGGGVFLLTGTPGTGKSGFGLYAVIQFLRKGELVWYKRNEEDSVVFVGSGRAKLELNKAFPEHTFEVRRVYTIPGTFESKLESITSIIRVHDPASNKPVSLRGQYFEIIVSSPNKTKLVEVEKSPLTEKYYMPLWSLPELEQVGEFHALDRYDIFRRFRYCGGVPRAITLKDTRSESPDPMKWKKVIEEACSVTTLEDCRTFFVSSIKGKMSFRVVHMRPSDDLRSFTYRLASREVVSVLISKFDRLSFSDVDWIVTACKGESFLQSLRGDILEKRWHGSLAEGGSFEGLVLGKTSRGSQRFTSHEPYSLILPSMSTFVFTSLDKLAKLDVNCYYQPRTRIHETIDSFAVLSGTVDKTKKKYIVLLFQMTVSRKHGLKSNGYRKLPDLFKAFLQDDFEPFFVFVSEKDKITTAQPILSDGENVAMEDDPAWKVEQVVLQMKNEHDLLSDLFVFDT